MSGERVTLSFDHDGLITASVDAMRLDSLIDNAGVIDVGEGRLLMTTGAADLLTGTVINNSGLIAATSLTAQGGDIVLQGNYVVNTGTVDASGLDGGSIAIAADSTLMAGQLLADGSAQGGTIATHSRLHYETKQASQSVGGAVAGHIDLAAEELLSSGTYRADGHTGGRIDIRGENIALRGATLSATGEADGGHVSIGGNEQPVSARTTVLVNTDIDVSSAGHGQGGTVSVVSKQATELQGAFRARGGALAGDGGVIRLASDGPLHFSGTVDTTAPQGQMGQLQVEGSDIFLGSAAAPRPGGHFGTLRDPYPGHGGVAPSLVTALPDADGSLLAVLTGARSGDAIGSGGLHAVGDGKYALVSPSVDAADLADAGAVTWIDPAAMPTGFVSEKIPCWASRAAGLRSPCCRTAITSSVVRVNKAARGG